MVQLTYDEKCKLLDIDPNELHKTLKHELSMAQLRTMEDEKVCEFQDAIGNCIEIETELLPLDGDFSRASFYTADGKVIVVKRKRFNVKLFFGVIYKILSSIGGNEFIIMFTVLNILLDVFVHILDEDMTVIYLFLCRSYYQNNRYFDNTEIFDKVNQHLAETQGVHWPDSKINRILLKLEDLRVIECPDGIFQPKDHIYLI
ncbi:hypothetical protein [Sporofaciens musculi]|uniref:hypothetical protein n=1 Tax=Sporofaciens musculi TaxID=2681861 RepID=UPI0025A01EF3|nr:hypothetical protein [Sporofaciens musculi]